MSNYEDYVKMMDHHRQELEHKVELVNQHSDNFYENGIIYHDVKGDPFVISESVGSERIYFEDDDKVTDECGDEYDPN